MPYHQDHDLPGASRHGEIIRLRRRLIRLQDQAQLLRRDLLQRKYNPDQPRVPAGNSGGGQWTSGSGGGGSNPGFGGGDSAAEFAPDSGTVFDESGEEAWSSYDEGWSDDGTVFERDIVNRDGSTIQSEYAASRAAGFDERHTVTLASGEKVSFEDTDRAQSIRFGGPDGELVSRSLWTPNGPERDATVQPAFAPLVAAPAIILGGAILFNWQSPFNGVDGQQAVMGFEAREYGPSAPGALDLTFSGRISQEEAEAACRYLPEMQARLDDVVAQAGPIRDYASASAYGTYVHTKLKEQIEAAGYRDVEVERSAYKEWAESLGDTRPTYGTPGTVRVDAIEYRRDGSICVYDFKTGKTGMSAPRFAELGRARYLSGRLASRAIVIEVRPRR